MLHFKKTTLITFSEKHLEAEIGKHSSLFAGFSQQDSQECLTAILERSHDDMKYTPISNDTDMMEQSWNTYLLSNGFSNVVKWFQGELQSTTQCSNKDCEHRVAPDRVPPGYERKDSSSRADDNHIEALTMVDQFNSMLRSMEESLSKRVAPDKVPSGYEEKYSSSSKL
eukprot:Em0005g162a